MTTSCNVNEAGLSQSGFNSVLHASVGTVWFRLESAVISEVVKKANNWLMQQNWLSMKHVKNDFGKAKRQKGNAISELPPM